MEKIPYFVALAVALIVIAVGAGFVSNVSLKSLGEPVFGSRITVSTSTKVAITTASVELLAGNSNRDCAYIVNDGANTMYINVGADAVANEGIRLNANGGSFDIESDNLLVLVINGITKTGTTTATVFECQ